MGIKSTLSEKLEKEKIRFIFGALEILYIRHLRSDQNIFSSSEKLAMGCHNSKTKNSFTHPCVITTNWIFKITPPQRKLVLDLIDLLKNHLNAIQLQGKTTYSDDLLELYAFLLGHLDDKFSTINMDFTTPPPPAPTPIHPQQNTPGRLYPILDLPSPPRD